MGMFREPSSQEIDIIKEMAESLGNAGVKLEEILDKTHAALERVRRLSAAYGARGLHEKEPDLDSVNTSIREFNSLVDEAENALMRLLIQREACGFRRHKNVNDFYAIPSKIRLIRS